MTYIGQQPATTFDAGIQDRFTGLSSNTVTLTHEIAAEEDILVVWNNIVQDKNTYSVGGTGNKTVTLGGTLVSADVVTVYYLNKVMQSVNPTAGSVTSTILGNDILSGQTDIGADIVDADLFLVDDGAGGTVRKTAASRLKTYVGGDNTPAIYAKLTSNQSVSNDSSTVASLATEILDSDGTFNNSNYRWTPAVAGYYMLVGSVYFPGVDDGERIYCGFFINGSESNHNSLRHGFTDWSPASDKAMHQTASTIIYLDGDDYVDWRIAQSSGDSQDASSDWTYMAGFRITGV